MIRPRRGYPPALACRFLRLEYFFYFFHTQNDSSLSRLPWHSRVRSSSSVSLHGIRHCSTKVPANMAQSRGQRVRPMATRPVIRVLARAATWRTRCDACDRRAITSFPEIYQGILFDRISVSNFERVDYRFQRTFAMSFLARHRSRRLGISMLRDRNRVLMNHL